MEAYLYPMALAALSLLVLGLEALFPWRREQRLVGRWTYLSDLAHLIFNGHFLGVILFGIATTWILPRVDAALAALGWTEVVHRSFAADWPLWVQIPVALLAIDFAQWGVHVMLHRVSWLWELHKTHHSIVDGEMSWIASFRFQWTEVVVYRACLYLPLAFLGFSGTAVMAHAIIGTLIGHLNHANLNLSWGPLRYVLNSPRMHIWHHDYEGDAKTTVNFGIIFSIWDWVLGTAKMPDAPPAKLGFRGVESFPRDFLSQTAWPLSAWAPARKVAPALGLGVLALGFWLHVPRGQTGSTSRAPAFEERLFGERAATTQPTTGDLIHAASPEEAEAALAHFGRDAERAGYAHPEWMVSVSELAAALGADRLVVLDVRPPDRFEAGHVPTARRLGRSDYSASAPVPGISRRASELQTMLRRRGVDEGDEIVVMGDGPEAHRLWWTLRHVAGLETRVLDGGVVRWTALGGALAAGPGRDPREGSVTLQDAAPTTRWATLPQGAVFLDARTPEEHAGEVRHRDAARAGRIPGARSWPYEEMLRSEGDPRLRPPAEIRARFDASIPGDASPVVLYCQSGTRSSVSTFALLQAGVPEAQVVNYDGSWAEYSRSDRPVETGAAQCLAC